jgi:diguanylate cyclase (GGDEF)-like protein
LQLAERVRKEAKKLKFETDEAEFSITLSMGVATFPDDARTKESLIENADEALYYAKEHGRNKVVAYHDIKEESTGPLLVAGRY